VKLFRYLVESTREDKVLKETIIAIDVFGRDSSFDPSSDSIVRSNIYNLRKKLDSYYLSEGADDLVKIVIPKGSYKVKFNEIQTKPSETKQKPTFNSSALVKFLFPLTILLLTIFVILFFTNKSRFNNKEKNNNPIWGYYHNSENPLIIVLGDYFMMQKTQLSDGSFNFVRDPEINSQLDLIDYLDKNPGQKESLKKLGQNYFGDEIPKSFYQLLRLLSDVDKPISMKYASELTLDDIRANDLIFVGDLATLGILKPFFFNTGFRYSIMPPAIYILDQQQDTSEYISLNNPEQSVFQNDYAIVSNLESYEGKRILFFVSFFPFGKSEALYKFSETSFLEELTDSSSTFPTEWNLLMKISGLQSTGFYYEILKFEGK
jgi:hypothetical protein